MNVNKKIIIGIFVGLLIIIPCLVFAVDTGASKITNPLGTSSPEVLIGRVIKAALGIVGSIALLMFIYGGFLWLTSMGSEQKITKGKQVITWAVIGLAVIFLSYAAVGFVIDTLTGKERAPTPSPPIVERGTCVCTGGDGKTTYGTTPDECLASAPQYKPCDWTPDK